MSVPTYQIVGDNAKFYYSTDNVTFTAFAAIEEITGNKIKAAVVKTTKLDSTAETRQGGLPDFGQFSAKIRFDKTISATIIGWQTNRTLLWFKADVKNNDGSTYTSESCAGFVEEFDPFGQLVNNKEVISDITISLSGTATGIGS